MQKKVPCEVWSRVVGYLSPIQRWNNGKKQEWKDRTPYKEPKGESMIKA